MSKRMMTIALGTWTFHDGQRVEGKMEIDLEDLGYLVRLANGNRSGKSVLAHGAIRVYAKKEKSDG